MNNHKNISSSIREEINKAQNILLLSHKRPDGDTAGSNLAFNIYLKKISKNVTSFCLNDLPYYLKFLPQSDLLKNDHLIFTKKYDLVIIFDSGSLEYAGVSDLLTAIKNKYILINIDHHATNLLYGDINLVITDASSTAEIIFRLFKDWDISWNNQIATCLACGIITDTGGFLNPATNYQSLAAASELVDNGANINEIVKITLSKNNLLDLKIWGKAFERLSSIDKYDLVYTFLTEKDYIECGVDKTATDNLVNFLQLLKEARIVLLLTEIDGMIKGSFRTTEKNIDVSKLANLFGGGGHKKAAAFSFAGKLVIKDNKLKIG